MISKIIKFILGSSIALSIIYFDKIFKIILIYAETYLSYDNKLAISSVNSITLYLIFVIIMLFIIFFLSFNKIRILITNILEIFIDIKKTNHFLFTDKYTVKPHTFYSFTLSSILSVCFLIYYSIMGMTYNPLSLETSLGRENTLENIMQLPLLLGAIFFLLTILHIVLYRKKIKDKNYIILILFVLLILSLFIFGEEISWGQRIYDFKVPNFFVQYNIQEETNLHNFFNPFFPLLYPAFGISITIISLALWFFPKTNRSTMQGIFEPHPSLILLILIMSSFSVTSETEDFEQLFSIFSVFYSFRIYLCFRNPVTLN